MFGRRQTFEGKPSVRRSRPSAWRVLLAGFALLFGPWLHASTTEHGVGADGGVVHVAHCDHEVAVADAHHDAVGQTCDDRHPDTDCLLAVRAECSLLSPPVLAEREAPRLVLERSGIRLEGPPHASPLRSAPKTSPPAV